MGAAACHHLTSASAQEQLWSKHAHEGHRLQALGRYREARDMFGQALRTAHEVSPNGPAVAATLDSLASVHEDLGEYAESEKLRKRAILMLKEKSGAAADLITRTIQFHLARMYLETGRLSKAEPLIRQDIDYHVKRFGADSPTVVRALSELATLLALKGKHDEAEVLLRRMLAMVDRHQGEKSVTLANILLRLASVVSTPGRHREALAYAERSSSILSTIPNPPSIGLVLTASIVGSLQSLTGRHNEAELNLRRAVEIAETFFGPGHPRVGHVLDSYAVVLRRMGRKQEAKAMEKRANLILVRSAKENGLGYTVEASSFLPAPADREH